MMSLVRIILPALTGAALLATCLPAMADPVGCQAFMDTYEAARSEDQALPALFSAPFLFADLKPVKVGDVVIEGRLEELSIEVKNHTGYLDCAPGDQFAILELCANLVPKEVDPYLNERFFRTSQALLTALSPGHEIETLVTEAGKDLKAALVRGDSIPRGVSEELELGELLYAKVYTNPEFPGDSPAQMCFLAEYFEE